MAIKGEAKKLYQREYMRRYMKRLRAGVEPSDIEAGDDSFDKKCQACGYIGVYDIHHKDRDYNNNKIDNLIILCPTCHAKIHRRGISNVKTCVRPKIPGLSIEGSRIVGPKRTCEAPWYDPSVHKAGDRVRVWTYGRIKTLVLPEIDADGHPIPP